MQQKLLHLLVPAAFAEAAGKCEETLPSSTDTAMALGRHHAEEEQRARVAAGLWQGREPGAAFGRRRKTRGHSVMREAVVVKHTSWQWVPGACLEQLEV